MSRRTFIFAFSILATGAAFMFRPFLKNRLKSSSEDFRDRVLKLAKKTYPGVTFEVPVTSPDVIVASGTQIGLQNLKAKFEQSDRSEHALQELVEEHFHLGLQIQPPQLQFDDARKRLKPQIMPPEFANQVPIISFPFGKTLAIGIVLDGDRGYRYLTRDDALRWNKSHKELLDYSITNLDEASRQMEMHSSENEEAKWIGIEVKDGFDAARILIPKFREFLVGRLGAPFCFAIPNRDFLICWNADASARFKDFTVTKIQKDFKAQPYPLSRNVFEVTADGVITERE